MEWDADKAREMRANGAKWSDICRAFHMTHHKVRASLDPQYLAVRAERTRRAKESYQALGKVIHPTVIAASRIDVAARLAEIPPDTRTLTARVFGDPLSGRSALDRRTKRAGETR